MDDDIRDYAEAHNKIPKKARKLKVPSNDNQLMWQIAGGILIAAAVIFAVEAAIERYREQQAILAVNKVIEEMQRETNKALAESRLRQQEYKRVRAEQAKARAQNKVVYDQLQRTCSFWQKQYYSDHDPLDKEWMDRACEKARDFKSKNPIY